MGVYKERRRKKKVSPKIIIQDTTLNGAVTFSITNHNDYKLPVKINSISIKLGSVGQFGKYGTVSVVIEERMLLPIKKRLEQEKFEDTNKYLIEVNKKDSTHLTTFFLSQNMLGTGTTLKILPNESLDLIADLEVYMNALVKAIEESKDLKASPPFFSNASFVEGSLNDSTCTIRGNLIIKYIDPHLQSESFETIESRTFPIKYDWEEWRRLRRNKW